MNCSHGPKKKRNIALQVCACVGTSAVLGQFLFWTYLSDCLLYFIERHWAPQHAQRMSQLTCNTSITWRSSVFLACLWICQATVCFLSLPLSIFSITRRNLSPISLQSQAVLPLFLSTSAISTNDMRYSLELPSHDVCLCVPVGFRPSQYSCLQWTWVPNNGGIVPNLPPSSGTHVLGAVVAPEMIITWALRRWSGARRLEKLYKGELSSLIHPRMLNHKILRDLKEDSDGQKLMATLFGWEDLCCSKKMLPRGVLVLSSERFFNLLTAVGKSIFFAKKDRVSHWNWDRKSVV